MRRVLATSVALALVVPSLTSCALLGGDDHLGDALEITPDSATRLVFRDREAIAERLGVDDVEDGASEDDLRRYAEAVDGDPTDAEDLLTEFVVAMQDAEMSELDVRWSVGGLDDDGAFTAYRLDDEVDLGAVADALADSGYAESDLRGRRHLVLDASDDASGLYPSNWLEVTVDPDEHLLVVGSAEGILRVVDDEAESLADTDALDDLLDDAGDVQYALVGRPPACGSTRATPEQLEAAGVADLGTPEATAFVVSGDDAELRARIELEDDDAAEADLDARRTYLEEGDLAATGEPVSDLGSFDLSREGSVVRVDLDLDEPTASLAAAQQQDGFLACTP
ncbi:hypothetical protein [Nocardioides sp.]|uniref:hypothetical protein n=1 Tax=Nocardioides sp. TaxID=35761 RepID=UPI0027290F6C|nr:hypothetical protein [Nocardioides sp.]MDO9456207.1 hypothetical protein [Nocardioides sp.]